MWVASSIFGACTGACAAAWTLPSTRNAPNSAIHFSAAATTSCTSRENRSCPHVPISLMNPTVCCRQQRGETEPSAPCLPPVSTTAPHLSSTSRVLRRIGNEVGNFRASAAETFAPPPPQGVFVSRLRRRKVFSLTKLRRLAALSSGICPAVASSGTGKNSPLPPAGVDYRSHLSSASRDEPLRCPPAGPDSFARGFTRPPPTKPRRWR